MSTSWRITVTRIVGILLPPLVVATIVFSQTLEREKLTEPTYRVSKSNDLTPAAAVPDPIASPLAAPLTSPTPVPGSRPELDSGLERDHRPMLENGPISECDPASDPALDGAAEGAAAPVESEAGSFQPNESQAVFDRAMSDAREMLQSIKRDVKDYTCVFIKREKVKGKIVGPQYILVKVRNRQMDGNQIVTPFAVYMKFVKPSAVKGREALYIEGENGGKVLAKEGGTKGRFMPSLYLPTTSRFVMVDNRYPITEFGVETLTQRLIDRGVADRNIADTIVTYKSGATVCGRACRFLEVRREQPKVGDDVNFGMNVPLARVFIDEEFNVPIRYVAYDWPVDGESPEVLEEYTYQNLKINVGLTDADFDKKNPSYGF